MNDHVTVPTVCTPGCTVTCAPLHNGNALIASKLSSTKQKQKKETEKIISENHKVLHVIKKEKERKKAQQGNIHPRSRRA